MTLPKFNLENCVHFITINTDERVRLFRQDDNCQIIIDNLDFYRRKFGFKLIGYVIMPDYLHLLMQLSEKYNDISRVMQQFKSRVAREIIDDLKKTNQKLLHSLRIESEPLLGFRIEQARSRGSELPAGWFKRSKYRIWQPDFYDFNICSDKKLIEKLNYIHNNPVRANLCKNPVDWLYSSFRNYYLNDNSIIKIDRINSE